jgi:hypothetical protein
LSSFKENVMKSEARQRHGQSLAHEESIHQNPPHMGTAIFWSFDQRSAAFLERLCPWSARLSYLSFALWLVAFADAGALPLCRRRMARLVIAWGLR